MWANERESEEVAHRDSGGYQSGSIPPSLIHVHALSDRDLIREIAGQNGGAFDELWRRYFPGLRAYTMRQTESATSADFAAGEILMLIRKESGSFSIVSQGSVHSWIYGIANGYLEWLQKVVCKAKGIGPLTGLQAFNGSSPNVNVARSEQ